MKRLAFIAAAALVAMVLLPAPASAQMDLLMTGTMNDMPADTFGCGGAALCNLYTRIYPDVNAAEFNQSATVAIDGWPSYRSKATRYLGDTMGTGNFSAAANAAACQAWYAIHTGAVNPGLGTFISYYGSQSQIANFGDSSGNSNFADCALGTGPEACFSPLDTSLTRPASTNTPVGANIAPDGALAPVPVPRVTSSDTAGLTVGIAWPAAAQAKTLNTISTTAAACPPGTPADLNDLTQSVAPTPVYGVGLFVHTLPTASGFRSLASLEGGDATGGVLNLLQNDLSAGIACTGASNCPGVHPVPCTGVSGATCVGTGLLFAPTAQNITLTQSQVDAALGADGPLDASKVAVFNTKVFFRCSVPGSCANPANTTTNPAMVTLFSANSSRVSFGALVSRVVFDREAVVEGNRVTLSWTTIGGPFVEFRVQRSDNGIEFTQVGTVAATGAESYQFTDTFRGRRPNTATYRLIVVEPTGESQILTTVDLSPGSRAPRR